VAQATRRSTETSNAEGPMLISYPRVLRAELGAEPCLPFIDHLGAA